jgi:CheY-like chemotaxis protein
MRSIPNGSVLVVDDDSDDRFTIINAFKEIQSERLCIPLEHGDQLMKYLASVSPDNYPSVILLDLNMPFKDGKEVLRELKEDSRYKHIPTVVLTTSTLAKDKAIVYKLGANCFVSKPSKLNEFINIIKSISRIW